MSTTQVTVIKPLPDSKVGVNFDHTVAGRMFVSKVTPHSLCADAGLQVGQELISINGTAADGKSVSEMKAVIGQAKSKVVFTIKDEASLLLKVAVEGSSINYTRNRPPKILADVPKEKWHLIYDAVTNDLLDVLAKADAKNRAFTYEMKTYVQKQMVKGAAGFGTESGHERKVLGMLYTVTASSNNAVLVATNILAKSNALLNSHGILVQLVIEERATVVTNRNAIPPSKTLLPVGLSFSKM